jgi:hypothetical protein
MQGWNVLINTSLLRFILLSFLTTPLPLQNALHEVGDEQRTVRDCMLVPGLPTVSNGSLNKLPYKRTHHRSNCWDLFLPNSISVTHNTRTHVDVGSGRCIVAFDNPICIPHHRGKSSMVDIEAGLTFHKAQCSMASSKYVGS